MKSPCGQQRRSSSVRVEVDGQAVTEVTPNSEVVLFAIGLGATDPVTPQVTFGTNQLPPEAILFAGTVPDSPGYYQMRIRIPDAAADLCRLTITIGDTASPPGPVLRVAGQ